MNVTDVLDEQQLVRLAAAVGLIVVVAIASRVRRLGLEGDLLLSTMRAFIQLSATALLLTVVFELDDLLIVMIVLVGMMCFAAFTASRRLTEMPSAFRVTALPIFSSAIVVIATMVMLGVIPPTAAYMITLGGMVIGNCMNVTAMTLDRLMGEVRSKVLEVDGRLALGAEPAEAMLPLIRDSLRAALIPTIDNMKTLGLVWIPGLMSGMIIAGSDPWEAAMLQLVIILMILTSNALSSILATSVASRSMFGDAKELTFRGSEQ